MAGALLLVEQRWPARGQASAVRYHAQALESANLVDLHDSAAHSVVLEYETQASRQDFEYTSWLYNERIPEIARPIWLEVRRTARAKADEEYVALRSKAASLGRAQYQRLSAEERGRIIRSRSFDRYIVIAGVAALPDAERRRIPDPEAFYRRRDRSAYARDEAWRHVTDEEKVDLGGAGSLSDDDTPAKLNYFDKVAKPGLTAAERGALAKVSRDDAESLGVFVSKHGERLLLDRLTKVPPKIAGLDALKCSSPAADRGALLHGPTAVCSAAGGNPRFGLARISFEWLVTRVDGFTLVPQG
ncbi:MAG: hypothetical protein IH936_11350 [Acidobacteria bacterium]|nr:hypothetical protein [Acidobacteriota bacterium]